MRPPDRLHPSLHHYWGKDPDRTHLASDDRPRPLFTSHERPGICWECDASSAVLVRAVLPLPSGRSVTIDLCVDCYQTRYLELLGELPGHAAMLRVRLR